MWLRRPLRQRAQAVILLREIVAKDARNADARLLLGSLLMEAGERDESIIQLTEGVRLRPGSADAVSRGARRER